MQKDLNKITDYWENIYSRKIKKYRPFEISEDFKKFASIFALGNSYLYIVNLHNLKLEYVSDSVEIFIKKKVDDINLQDLLQTILPEELAAINLKSKVISDFYTSYIDRADVMKYKNLFSYRMEDRNGQVRTMLYQAFPLSVLENGTPEHVCCIQTDVSHLKVASTNSVSFIHINGGQSYYNIDISQGIFSPDDGKGERHDLSKLLTEREKQIIIRLSKGLNAEQIAAALNLSPHTIKTHRKNILNKSGCNNTTELVAKCLTNGIISPGLI